VRLQRPNIPGSIRTFGNILAFDSFTFPHEETYHTCQELLVDSQLDR